MNLTITMLVHYICLNSQLFILLIEKSVSCSRGSCNYVCFCPLSVNKRAIIYLQCRETTLTSYSKFPRRLPYIIQVIIRDRAESQLELLFMADLTNTAAAHHTNTDNKTPQQQPHFTVPLKHYTQHLRSCHECQPSLKHTGYVWDCKVLGAVILHQGQNSLGCHSDNCQHPTSPVKISPPFRTQ